MYKSHYMFSITYLRSMLSFCISSCETVGGKMFSFNLLITRIATFKASSLFRNPFSPDIPGIVG